MTTHIEKDPHSGTETTGHVWDGLRELNTPLPKWWLYTWLACIVWAFGLMLLYPSLPYFTGYWHGLLGYSTRTEVMQDVAKIAGQRALVMDKVAAASFEQIRATPALLAEAQTAGRTSFANNCQPCHGAGGGGRPGYPALAAGAWLWGGRLEDIQQTLQHGIRSGAEGARDSQMPRFGVDGVLKPEEIVQVASFVMTLYGTPRREASAETVAAGAALFADNCAACHGEKGQGNREFGAPALASRTHLYGDSFEIVQGQITNPHMGVMPAWGGKLDPATIKSLAIYVHDLGGGE